MFCAHDIYCNSIQKRGGRGGGGGGGGEGLELKRCISSKTF